MVTVKEETKAIREMSKSVSTLLQKISEKERKKGEIMSSLTIFRC